MAPLRRVTVVEHCRIPPFPSSAADGGGDRPSLPFTYFDLLFYRFQPVQRVLFYAAPHYSSSQFLDSQLPDLKRSLALALHRFYPLAGRLTQSSDLQMPEISCSARDSISLLVAASGDDFHELSGDRPRDVTRFRPLLPSLQLGEAVLAVQVTVFPNAGIAIGTTLHHAVADGSTYTHFMKTWAAIHRSGGDPEAAAVGPPPLIDRTVVADPRGLEGIFLGDLQALKEDPSLEAWDLHEQPGVELATFVFSSEQLRKLKQWVFAKTSAQCSSYAVACGHVWSCLVKARGADGNNKIERFGFVTGCRARSDPPVPANYFGNCLGICCVDAERSKVAGQDGTAEAAAAIWEVIMGLEETGGAFRRAEDWMRDVYDYAAAKALTVSGSPKLGLYEVDFGWGRPRKVELVSVERTGAVGLAEGREDKGGIEAGLALPRGLMEGFANLFADGLKEFS